MQSIHNFNSH